MSEVEKRKVREWQLKAGSKTEVVTDEGSPVCKIFSGKTKQAKLQAEAYARLITKVPKMVDRLIVAREVLYTLKVPVLADTYNELIAEILGEPLASPAQLAVTEEDTKHTAAEKVEAQEKVKKLTDSRKRKCPACKKTFKTKRDFIDHLDECHGVSEEQPDTPARDIIEDLKDRGLAKKYKLGGK